jgi:hypothetical protein
MKMNRLTKIWCWMFGHDMHSLYTIDNGRSTWGEHKCMRCDQREHWQWDY